MMKISTHSPLIVTLSYVHQFHAIKKIKNFENNFKMKELLENEITNPAFIIRSYKNLPNFRHDISSYEGLVPDRIVLLKHFNYSKRHEAHNFSAPPERKLIEAIFLKNYFNCEYPMHLMFSLCSLIMINILILMT